MGNEPLHPMMKCGHAAQGTHHLPDGTDEPCCIICFGIHPGANVIDDAPPSLEGRMARCSYYGKPPRRNECDKCRSGGTCQCERPSDPERLAFFQHHPDRQYDEFYCGCHGWD